MPDISKLHFYSLGIVAVNKTVDQTSPAFKEIEVVPYEDNHTLSGEITDNKFTRDVSGVDADGIDYKMKVDMTVSIKAGWLPINSSNRITPPNVRRGETVIIYRFGDTDTFFWSTLKDDSHLRKLETVIYAWSGTTDESVTSVDPDNYYFLEISTHKKLIHFSTSTANGEFCKYDIQINPGNGFIMVQDDHGNYFSFDTKNFHLEMKNKQGSVVEIIKENINHVCTGTITQKANKIVQVCTTHTLNASTSTITAESTHVGNTTHKGNFTLMGNLTMAGGAGGGGNGTISGTLDIVGVVRVNSDVIISGKSFLGHTHNGVHGVTSPPI